MKKGLLRVMAGVVAGAMVSCPLMASAETWEEISQSTSEGPAMYEELHQQTQQQRDQQIEEETDKQHDDIAKNAAIIAGGVIAVVVIYYFVFHRDSAAKTAVYEHGIGKSTVISFALSDGGTPELKDPATLDLSQVSPTVQLAWQF